MLDDTLLSKFIERFFGYGNLDAPNWYIGMEEGGGDKDAELAWPEIAARLQVWHEMGALKVIGLRDFHDKVARLIASERKLLSKAPINRWFMNRMIAVGPPIQRTWGGLIRIDLSLGGKSNIETDDIRESQQSDFGTLTGGQCLLELLPLPKPSLTDWPYKDLSDIEYLKNFVSYKEKILDDRVAGIRELIKGRQTKPKNVFFYGSTYTKHWENVAGGVNWKDGDSKSPLRHAFDGTTNYYIVRHPARTILKSYFNAVGKFARQRSDSN
jgi:ribosomal protein S18